MAEMIKIRGFQGGLSTADSTIIEDTQLSLASNVYYDKQGILSSRKGTTPLGSAVTGVDNVHSLYFTTLTDGTRILLAGADTKVFKYNEGTTAWDTIDTGLTADLKLSFVTYKDQIYWSNGTDDVRKYDGTTVSTKAGMLKAKYLLVQNDVAYAAGITGDLSTVFYTNANPADLDSTLTAGAANNEPINQDEGIITGLSSLGIIVAVGKDNGIYSLNVFGATVDIQPIDFDGNCSSHRSFVNAENDLMVMSDRGVYSIAQRSGTTSSFRAYPFSAPIQKEIDKIEDKSTVAAFYFRGTSNVYFSVDSGEANQNDKLFVYSVLASAPGQTKYVWTQYENINANDFCEYEDSDGNKFLLYADAFKNEVFKMETEFIDQVRSGADLVDVPISWSIRTKTFEFDSPELWKTVPFVDAGGLIGQQQTVTFGVDMDGVLTEKTFTGEDYATGDDADALPLGEVELGEDPLGSGPVSDDGVIFYPFIVRRPYYSSGHRISVTLSGNSTNTGFKLTKLNVPVETHDLDILNNNYIIS